MPSRRSGDCQHRSDIGIKEMAIGIAVFLWALESLLNIVELVKGWS